MKNKYFIAESNKAVKELQENGFIYQGTTQRDFTKVHVADNTGKIHTFSNAIEAKEKLLRN